MSEIFSIELADELADIATEALKKVLRAADKHGLDRDKVYGRYIYAETGTAMQTTFKDYDLEGEENE